MLISVLVLSVSIIIFSIVGILLKNASGVRHGQVALRIAHTKLDDLRADGYAALPAGGTFSDPLLNEIPSGEASTTVTTYNAKTKRVMVGVSWDGVGGTERYLSLSTLITETGGL